MGSAFKLLKETYREWSADKAPRLGAALAYYAVFSIAPLLVIAVGIAALVFGEKAAQGLVAQDLQHTLGKPAAQAIEELLKNNRAPASGTTATIVGLVVLLIGASGVFLQLQDALNTIWKVQAQPGLAIRQLVRDRLVSFLAVLGAGLLVLASLVLNTALAALSRWFNPEEIPGGVVLWQGLNSLVSVAFIALLFAWLYKVLPDVRTAWADVWVGAVVTAVFFAAGNYLLGFYLGRDSTTSPFGAAGALVVILLWVYYSAQIFLFGAEFTRVYARHCGRRPDPKEGAAWCISQASTSSR